MWSEGDVRYLPQCHVDGYGNLVIFVAYAGLQVSSRDYEQVFLTCADSDYLRWNYSGKSGGLWLGPSSFSYDWWAVMTTILVVMGWRIYRECPNFVFDMVPRLRPVLAALFVMIFWCGVSIPLALKTGFITLPPKKPVCTHYCDCSNCIKVREK